MYPVDGVRTPKVRDNARMAWLHVAPFLGMLIRPATVLPPSDAGARTVNVG